MSDEVKCYEVTPKIEKRRKEIEGGVENMQANKEASQ